ncbi:EAL domain-containing protein [Marinobacterium sp. A346]|uniref:EAL domain-containing protein n=2 Tax=Marinobacterium weihaiense TaxID=2851016 RepID=A0ABS6M7I5_9GAMM|nr:EAL domain-containing protein [Marinobacterium weihaiense]
MAEYHVGSVLVEHQGKQQGLITRRRAMQFILERGGSSPVTEAMLLPVLRVQAGTDIDTLGLEMLSRNLMHALVYGQNDRCLGIISQTDIVNSQGLEHDLDLKPLCEVASFDLIRLGTEQSLQAALERMQQAGHSAALVGTDRQWRILTETDAIRFLSSGIRLDLPLADLPLATVVSLSGTSHLHQARHFLHDRGFRHIGVTNDEGEVVGLASYHDILRSLEQSYVHRLRGMLDERGQDLRQSRHDLRLIEQVINASHEGVVITDTRGRIQSVNRAFTSITGYSSEEALGRNPSMLSSGRHGADFYHSLWQRLGEEGQWQGEIWNRRKDGQVYPEWLSITAIRNERDEVTQYAAIFHDLTEMKRSEARVEQLSWFDSVTGLANRRLFEDRLQLAHAYCHENGQRLALLAIDLDLFKQINDRFGHRGGDQLLHQVAERIESTLVQQGTAARPAGDEFYIILSEQTDPEALSRYLDSLSQSLAVPFWLAGEEVRLMASIGVAVAPDDAESAEALIRAAEIALHHSKEQGRNTICFFSPEQHQAALSRYRLAGYLQQALERNEFHMVYQPQIDVHDQRLIGVEALLRWEHPELGVVSPGTFIPVAEDAGLIDAIGQWGLERSVRDAVDWRDQGVSLKLAVNVSAREFQRGDVAERVQAVLSREGLSPESFVVELTETCFMQSADTTEQALVKLRRQGVRIAIDDFGTGFSSLSYIRNMSLDILKIDRSFITGVDSSGTGGQLVRAIVDMSHAMQLEVVAEGVETTDDLMALQRLGCDQAQGYHVARPMPADELLQWAAAYAAGKKAISPL